MLWTLDTDFLEVSASVGEVSRLLNSVAGSDGGLRPAGLVCRETSDRSGTDLFVRMTQDPCDGAPACYWKRSGQTAVTDLGASRWGSDMIVRSFRHEVEGHAATSMHDMYPGSAHSSTAQTYSPGFMGGGPGWALTASKGEVESAKAWFQGRATHVHQH
jgi:hypothetical protein